MVTHSHRYQLSPAAQAFIGKEFPDREVSLALNNGCVVSADVLALYLARRIAQGAPPEWLWQHLDISLLGDKADQHALLALTNLDVPEIRWVAMELLKGCPNGVRRACSHYETSAVITGDEIEWIEAVFDPSDPRSHQRFRIVRGVVLTRPKTLADNSRVTINVTGSDGAFAGLSPAGMLRQVSLKRLMRLRLFRKPWPDEPARSALIAALPRATVPPLAA